MGGEESTEEEKERRGGGKRKNVVSFEHKHIPCCPLHNSIRVRNPRVPTTYIITPTCHHQPANQSASQQKTEV